MKSITDKINEELKKIQELSPLPDIEEDDVDTVSLRDDIVLGSNSWDSMDTSSGPSLDDYIIQPLDFANLTPLLNSINISGTGGSGSLGIGASGSGMYTTSGYTTTNPSYSWNTLNQPSQVHITQKGIEMAEDADITFGGRSMKKMFESIEQRLSILVPDPKKLERYEALQQAYEHYRTLEALCNQEPDTDKK